MAAEPGSRDVNGLRRRDHTDIYRDHRACACRYPVPYTIKQTRGTGRPPHLSTLHRVGRVAVGVVATPQYSVDNRSIYSHEPGGGGDPVRPYTLPRKRPAQSTVISDQTYGVDLFRSVRTSQNRGEGAGWQCVTVHNSWSAAYRHIEHRDLRRGLQPPPPQHTHVL